jgi:hypothetical protein
LVAGVTAIVDQPFHAPVDADLIDSLTGQRDAQLKRMQELHGFISEGYKDAAGYFFNANPEPFNRYMRSVDEVFNLETGTKYLDSVFWQKALDQTDVYDCMPQARKDEWNDGIQKREVPEFTEENVRSTLGDLLMARSKFIAEKADGVFRRLSRTHVTNAPEGFRKRFIMDYCFGYGMANGSSAGYLDDLREIIAKYMGRELLDGRLLSGSIMDYARNYRRGEWVDLDGGALKIRCYKKGTMHIEVHPDIAWKLNQLLHYLYPAAIPSQFREPPKRVKKTPPVHDRPLSFACLRTLHNGHMPRGENSWCILGSDVNPAALKEAEAVLEQIGGVKDGHKWVFDYDPRGVIREIEASGVVPDQVSHQYYPTPPHIVEAMLEEAEVASEHFCLEPSAGTGAIADELMKLKQIESPWCVEISPLHCKILEGKGHHVVEADFLEWAAEQDLILGSFDRIVMNPPYSAGRALAHVDAALPLLKDGGRLVALLPSTYRNKGLPGRWAQTFDRFPGTSISVSIYVVDK